MRTLYDRTLDSLSRRDVLNAAWKLGLCAVTAPSISRSAIARPSFTQYPFSLGVASGDPTSTGIVLWTRLAPEPLDGGGMLMTAVTLRWQIALDESMNTIVQQGTELAHPELGHSVHVEVDGLKPGHEYWYRFMAGTETSAIGRTRTAPAPGKTQETLRIGVCGCNHYEQGYFTAYRHMAEQRFDAIFHVGDYIYEYRPTGGSNHRVRLHRGDETFTLVDYRNRYAQYRLDPDLQAAHASAPFIVTWDDHEVDNDWAAASDESNTPEAVFRLRRAAAFQAYYEAMPLRMRSFPAADHLQLYRQIRFGDLVSVNVLDTRQYRSRQICRGAAGKTCADLADPRRTMLGSAQERWVDRRLNDDSARWSVLAQQVPMFGRDATPLNQVNLHIADKWSGYPVAREKLMASVDSRTSGNVVVLAGDVHSAWAADIPRDMANPDGPTAAVEFTTTSVTSGGDGSDIADYWDAMKAEHPHVRYHNNRRGFLACEITPSLWQSDFMTLDRVTQPDGTLTREARVVVETGVALAQAD